MYQQPQQQGQYQNQPMYPNQQMVGPNQMMPPNQQMMPPNQIMQPNNQMPMNYQMQGMGMPQTNTAQNNYVMVAIPQILVANAMDKLMQSPGVFIKQKFELLEALTGCETENKYEVFTSDKDGEKKKKMILFKCKEKSDCLMRQCCPGNVRSFKAKVEHSSNIPGGRDGENCFEYERDYTCTILCLNRPVMKVFFTENNQKQYLGSIVNPCTFCDLYLEIFNPNNEMRFKIIGSCCQLGIWCKFPCEACQTIQFYVCKPDGTPLTDLMKKTAGCMKSFVSDADNFSLVFPEGSTAEDRALLLGAVIMLDFMYFEEGPPNRNNSSGGAGGDTFL